MRELGSLEAEVMAVLWGTAGPLTVREVRERILEQRPVAYTTVLTVMEKLFRKELLGREPEGRAHRYRPLVTREAYTAALMESALASSEDRAGALLHFVEAMPTAEVEALRSALREVGEARADAGSAD